MLSRCFNSAILVLIALLAGCAGNGASLNSERIESTFGSYGVDVLSEDDTRRLSSLYSLEGDQQVTRTLAVVDYMGEPASELMAEHARIVAGGSIGSTFQDAGWTIRKQHVYIGELEIPPDYVLLAELMQIELPATLAVHQYLFVVSSELRSFTYATITEVHHPAYLGRAQLQEIYGEIVLDDSNRDHIHEFIGPPPLN